MSTTKSPYYRFLFIAKSEAISYLVLLFIAMPLKYLADLPVYVKVVGWAHGILFIAYIITLLHLAYQNRWTFIKIFLAFMASLIPFAPFFLEKALLNR